MHFCSFYGHIECFEILTSSNADVNAISKVLFFFLCSLFVFLICTIIFKGGWTSLHASSFKGLVCSVIELIRLGADINAIDMVMLSYFYSF